MTSNDSKDTSKEAGSNGWWRLLVGILIGALAPSLVAWGSMSAKIESNTKIISTKVSVSTFKEYKEGNVQLLRNMCDSLTRIENKIDGRFFENK